ncbi:hypothetical protein [Mycobacteroides abscessus]|uniref:hypothetical protein n=1 Tax=Mycobacteroides abscessus TaxID=36809 RepID=UPI0011AB2049|nr:hypothetical protein [Mycobacteroides abscessus]
MPTPNQAPGESEYSWGPGLEPLDPATGKPFPVSRGGRYRGLAPRPGDADERSDAGQRYG